MHSGVDYQSSPRVSDIKVVRHNSSTSINAFIPFFTLVCKRTLRFGIQICIGNAQRISTGYGFNHTIFFRNYSEEMVRKHWQPKPHTKAENSSRARRLVCVDDTTFNNGYTFIVKTVYTLDGLLHASFEIESTLDMWILTLEVSSVRIDQPWRTRIFTMNSFGASSIFFRELSRKPASWLTRVSLRTGINCRQLWCLGPLLNFWKKLIEMQVLSL